MDKTLRSPGLWLGLLALLIACSGSAYAAGLAADSVGTRHLKDNAVNSSKIKDGTIKDGDLRADVLPTDADGARVRGYARIGSNGVVQHWGGDVMADVTSTRIAEGVYCIGLGPSYVNLLPEPSADGLGKPSGIWLAEAWEFPGFVTVNGRLSGGGACPAEFQVIVSTFNTAGVADDRSFLLTLLR